jgi:hypothetical protein
VIKTDTNLSRTAGKWLHLKGLLINLLYTCETFIFWHSGKNRVDEQSAEKDMRA